MPANIAESYWGSRGIQQGPEDELAQSARALLNGNQSQWSWTPSGIWICLVPAGVKLAPQGWKLHISATSRNAAGGLAAVAPILIGEGVPFKFAATRKQMALLNSSDTPREAAGKFITVYPLDDAQALRLAEVCDVATRGLHGPAILSDRALRPGSLVHYRYGAFQGSGAFDKDGQMVSVIRDPQGGAVPDERRAWFTPPEWVTHPFAAAQQLANTDAPQRPVRRAPGAQAREQRRRLPGGGPCHWRHGRDQGGSRACGGMGAGR